MPGGATRHGLRLDAEQLLRSLAEGVLVVDPQSLEIRVANAQAEVVTGHAIAELVGGSLALLRGPEDGDEAVTLESLVHLPGRHDEVHLRRRDGTAFVASVHVTLAEEEGRPLAILLLHDVSERRKLERELLTKHAALGEAYRELDERNAELRLANEALDQRNEELRRANEEIRTAQRWLAQLEKMATVGRFAAGVAHEVNNPMAFVLENLQRLQDHVGAVMPVLQAHLDDPAVAGTRAAVRGAVAELETIVDESLLGAQRVSGIVRQLHSFSNVGDQEAEWIDLREVVESAIMMVKNQILQRARLERHYFDARRVSGVAGQLGQVMVNVLVNAIQAIPEGHVDRNCVMVRIRPAGDHVALEVQDTGVGIPPEHLPQILEPFFTTKPAGTGSGLGLSISARIVEQHGGRIEVESTVGTGTLVRVVLPIQGKLKVRRQTGTSPAVAPVARLRLLVVDDELFLLRALKRNLARDHDVETASSAADALAHLAAHPEIDVVIADMMMPDEDGVALYERAVAAHPHLRERFVFMTGGVFTDRVRAFLEGVNLTVLSKPIRREDLQQAIASFTRVPGAR